MGRLLPDNHAGWPGYLMSIFPGLALCFFLGALARGAETFLMQMLPISINYVLLAIMLGLLARNLFPAFFPLLQEGVGFAAKTCLYIGIVLLGAGLNLVNIFATGLQALIMVAVSISFCIFFCGWFMKKTGGGERWGHLVGAGIGVCGISAIMSLSPVIKSRGKEVFAAVSAVLINDAAILILLPILGHSMGWSDSLAGFFAGVVPSNTAQCIAIGYAYSQGAGDVATVVKSARNALMPLFILFMAYLYTVKGLPVGEKVQLKLLWQKFPKFILGFLAASLLNTSGILTAETIAASRFLSSWFFTISFVGIGAGINLKDFNKKDLGAIGAGLLTAFLLGFYAYFYSVNILSL